MGVFDKVASAYLTVVGALSVLRPSGKWWTSDSKISVIVHEGNVGQHSQGKYLVTVRHRKEKQQTKKRKSDGLTWEHAVQFSHWSPSDPLVLKLRKAKRCKDATIAKLSIDVAAVLESADGLPNKWWYAMERLDKGGRQKEDVFLQITVTVDGREVKSGATPDPAAETATTAAQEKPQTPPELKVNSPPSASTTGPTASQPAAVSTSGASRDKPTAKTADEPSHECRGETGTSDRSCHAKTSSLSAAGDITVGKPVSSIPPSSSPPAPLEKTGTGGHGEGDAKVGSERLSHDKFKVVEVPQTVPDAADGSTGHGDIPDPTRPSEKSVMTAGQENPESSAELGELTAVIKDVPAGTKPCSRYRGRGPDLTMPYENTTVAAGQEKPEAELNEVTDASKDQEVPQLPTAADGPTGDINSSQGPDVTSLVKDKETNSQAVDKDKETATPQGGNSTTKPKKDKYDPELEQMEHVWSVEDLWDEFTTMREYADDLDAYAESLRGKLAGSVPHVLDYPVIKNLLAHVPERKSYDLPDTEGLGSDDLDDIEDTLVRLLKDEANRATYLRRWVIDELLSVAMEVAPHVLGAQE
ncbi:uncharacterized protein LOC144880374 [Branchiostoma floridae x Branchiostoma japonicum]